MRKIFRILSMLLAIILCLQSSPLTASAATEELATGTYYVELTELATKAGRNPGYNKINVAPRAVLTVNQGNYYLTLRVYGYTHWNVLKYLSQEGYASVDSLAAGTDWTDYSGNEMSGYQTLADKSGDESTNSYWTTISKVRTKKVDTDKDMAIVAIQLSNLEDAFALGGYATTTSGESQFDYLAVQGYQLDLNTITSGTNLMYYAAGMEVENSNFELDYARTIPIVANIKYDNNNTLTGLFADNFVKEVTCVPSSGIINATFTVADDIEENIHGIHVLQSVSLDTLFEDGASKTEFQGYLLGTYGNTYGENIYDTDTKQFTISFNNNDKVNSLITGVDVKIVTDEHPDGYRAVLYLSESGMELKTLEDEATGTSYTSYAKYIANKNLIVKSGEDANAIAVSDVKNVADGDNWRAYSFYLQDEDGNSYMPQKGGVVRVPIPKEWDLDNTYIGFYTQSGKSTTTDSANFSTYATVVDTDTERYVEYTTQLNKWVADGSVVMCEVLNEADLGTLSEDGLYSVTAKFVKAGAEGVLSMADGCLERDAIVKIENGIKTVYLDFHPLLMAEEYCYLGAVWNKESSDCEHYSYEVNEDGSLIDNAGFDAVTEFPCLKSVKVTLSDDTIQDNSYIMKVVPPAMASGSSYDVAINSPIDVDLKFYNVEKIEDESTVQIPTYQKSVLRRSIDKAKLYNEASYSEETWTVLQTALNEGETYYNTLAGTDAGTDYTVSNAIKEKSDAIETAIANLAENPELAEARAKLKTAIGEAKAIELGNKTVSAFNELQAVINEAQATYERSNVSVDELNAQITALNEAVTTFNQSASASTLVPAELADGSYKVYVDMKKVDQVTDSMSNNAIDHWMNLEVKDDVYTASLAFTGLTISGQFGYLKSLKYYDAGYTYDSYGEPQGTLKDVTVISTQKNADGTDVVDSYNQTEGYLYPDVVSFPLVDKGTEDFVPLQVFVPIMESITEGTGTQNVLMQIDWTSLRLASDNTQDVFTFEEDGVYTLASNVNEADSDEVSAYNAYLEEARLLVSDNQVQVYLDFKKDGENFIKGIEVLDAQNNSIPVTTYYYEESGEIVRAVFTLPSNVELTDIKLTDNDDESGVEARLYLALRSAFGQSVDKEALSGSIASAEEKLQDGKVYTEASKQSLNEALEEAKAVHDDPVAVTNEISSAGIALKNAINDLVEIELADKAELETLLQAARTELAKIDIYTQETLSALQEAAAAATEVYNNANASQDNVDAQITLIQTALDNLRTIAAGADKEALQAKINEAKAVEAALYTPNSYEALTAAITNAETVLAQENLTKEEIDAQITALQAVVEGLIEKADKTDLQKVYDEASALTNDMGYAGWDTLQSVLTDAKTVLEDENADQNTVDAHYNAIVVAVNNLSGGIDKTVLADLISQAEALDVSGYSDASVAMFESAIVSAKAVLENAAATQQEVEKQIQLLMDASEALIQKEEENTVYQGVYKITGRMQHATSPEQASMGNAALKQPMQVIISIDEETGKTTAALRMELVSLTTAWGDGELTGYLAQLNYFEGVDENTLPTNAEAIEAAVESYYEDTYDTYNDPDFGTDAKVKGKLYPHYMTLPVELGDGEIWVQVYVPVMEAISEGSGLQYARLQLDWTTLTQIEGAADTDEETAAEKAALAEELAAAKELDMTDADEEDAAMLAKAMEAAQAVLDNHNVDAAAVTATREMLASAVAVFSEEAVEADKTELEKAIEAADSYLNNPDVKYTETTRQILQNARDNASSVLEDEQATQTQVNHCIEAIDLAIQSLIVDGTDKTELRKALDAVVTYLDATDLYTAASIDMLCSLYDTANAVYEGEATQEEVNAQVRILNYAASNLTPVEEVSVEKNGLHDMIAAAANQAGRESLYTAESIQNLKKTIEKAEELYLDPAATQEEVNAQASALFIAILNLEQLPADTSSGTGSGTNSGTNSGTDSGNEDTDDDDDNDSDDGSLDRYDLADGIYSITGKMVKSYDTDVKSMANDAINHNVMLTVKDGTYYLTLDFCGLNISGKYGYLGTLKYYATGYTLSGGALKGNLKSVTVNSYQKDSDGDVIEDSYGTNYPNSVTFKMIPEALDDGLVPLQVFVPIMESISSGTGTQPVFLKLSWSTLEKTTADDDAFDDKTSEDESDDDEITVNTNSLLDFTSTLTPATSLTAGTSLTGASTLKSTASALKSNTSSALKSSGLNGLSSTGATESTLKGLGELNGTEEAAPGAGTYTGTAAQTGSANPVTETEEPVSALPMVSGIVIALAGLLYKLKGKKFFGM